MKRVVRKPFFTSFSLLKKVSKLKPNPNKPIRIYSRASVIFPEHVGYTFEIHNGKGFVKFTPSEHHLFYRFGQFAPTRKYPGNRSKSDSKA